MANSSVIYIAGYGRSGSTLLEILLSSHPRVVGLGEVSQGLDSLSRGPVTCGCGATSQDCPIWGPSFEELSDDLRESWPGVQKYETLANSFRHLAPNSVPKEKYREIHVELFEALRRNTEASDPIFVDSSKTSRSRLLRPLLLERWGGLDVSVVHLVRDPRGCMRSNLKGSNQHLEEGREPGRPFPRLRTLGHWPLANLPPEVVPRSSENPRRRIQYESLVSRPSETMGELVESLGLDQAGLDKALPNGEVENRAHQIAGNRLRHRDEIRIRPASDWRKELALWERALGRVACFPLMGRYGYPYREGQE